MSTILSALTDMYTSATGTLTLVPGAVGVDGFAAALAAIFKDAPLTFVGVTVPPAEDGGTVSFAGAGLDLGASSTDIVFPPSSVERVTFDVHDAETNPAIVIAVVVKPAGGVWANCIPFFSDSFWGGVEWVKSPSGGVANGPAFIFSSKAVHDPIRGIDLPAGLSFYGQLDVTKGIVRLIPVGPATPAVAGITFSDAGVPRLAFPVGRATFPAIFGPTSTDIEVRLVSDEDPRACGLDVDVPIPWPGQPSPPRFSAVLPSENPGMICFATDQPLNLPSIDDFKTLGTFFGHYDLHNSLPGQFKGGGSSVKLSELAFGVGLLPSPSLAYCKLTLTALDKEKLTLCTSPLLEVEDIEFHFSVFAPGTKDAQCSFTLSGLLEIESAWFDVTGSLRTARPGSASQLQAGIRLAQLDQPNTISLTQIARHLGAQVDGLPEVDITELVIGFSKDESWELRLSANVADLSVSSQTQWAIESVGVGIDVSSSSSPDCSLEAVLKVAGATLGVTADVQSTGWRFKAATLPGQTIHIGDLIDDLFSRFGGQKQTNLTSFDITSLSLEIGSADKNPSYEFDIAASFQIAANRVNSSLHIAVSKPNDSKPNDRYDKAIDGHLEVGDQQFGVALDTTGGCTTFSGHWNPKNPGDFLKLRDLASPLSESLAQDLACIPSNLDLQLSDVAVGYDETDGIFGLAAHSKNYGALAFAVDRRPGGSAPPTYVVLLDVGKTIGLADVPLVGKALPFADAIKVSEISVQFASAAVLPGRLAKVIQCFQRCDPGYVRPKFDEIDEGGQLKATLQFGQNQSPLAWQFGTGTTHAAERAALDSPSADDTHWFAINKTFGPLVFKRVGFKYADNELFFVLDASLHIAALTFTLDGLSVSSPLTDFSPHFHLQGLALDFSTPAFSISGGLKAAPIKQIDAGDFEYDGELAIHAETFSVMAEGTYARITDPDTHNAVTSLFVFARLDKALGGPPYFYVTGLAGGFGYNRKLRVPQLDEVKQFPLVAGLQDPDVIGGAGATPGEVLQHLSEWVLESDGEMFVAAGIHFTSFEFVNSVAAIAVEFGKTFEILIVGLSTATVATEGETYAYAELALEATVRPSDGIFSVTATLTSNSYLLDPACHLTGGFAFIVWFGGDHVGDFVLTIGGYHPAYSKPAHYPAEQRVGFNWLVSETITIEGGAYFALTPTCVMAGGALEALYHSGDLRAWFTAHADLLVSWKPFHFDAKIGVSLGASYRLSLAGIDHILQVALAATVHLWGPAVGGKVHIQWFVISFTVSFGALPASVTMDWEKFSALLPQKTPPSNFCDADGLVDDPAPVTVECFRITSLDGLLGKNADAWCVRPEGFAFSISTAIPATRIQVVNPHGDPTFLDPVKSYGLDIRPLGVKSASSILTITVRSSDDVEPQKTFNWTLASTTVPEAMWGRPLDPNESPLSAAQPLPDRVVGLRRVVPVAPAVAGPPAITMASAYAPIEVCPGVHYLPLSPTGTPAKAAAPVADETSLDLIHHMVMDQTIASRRDAIYANLVTLGFAPADHGTLTAMQADPQTAFRTPPMIEGAHA